MSAIKDLFGIVSNCECECDKSCDIGEYLDYENCKCRKKFVDKLVEECTEKVEEVKLVGITSAEDKNKHKNKCSSCTLYIVLFSIIFSTYFAYYKYMNRDKKLMRNMILFIKKQFDELINGKYQTN